MQPRSIADLLRRFARAGSSTFKPFQNSPEEAGAVNAVVFGEVAKDMPEIAFSTNKVIEEIKTTSPEEAKKRRNSLYGAYAEVQASNDVQKLISDLGVDTRFLQKFLVITSKGEKLSPLAAGKSLHHYIESHSHALSNQDIIHIFGQIVLGVAALHEKNLVHRDLRSRNILIDYDPKIGTHAIVADLDDVVEVQPINGKIKNKDVGASGGTEYPFELQYFLVINPLTLHAQKWKEFKNDELVKYQALDHKAIDCYALGRILRELVTKAGPVHQNPALARIYRGLENDRTSQRMRIEDLLSEPIFGLLGNKQSSEEFFETLRASAPTKEVHSYTIRAVEPDDFFLTLAAPLKPLYELAQNLENKFKMFDSLFEEKMETLDKDALYAKYSKPCEAMYEIFKQYMIQYDSIAEDINQNRLVLENEKAVIRSMENLHEAIGKKVGQIQQMVTDKIKDVDICKNLIKIVKGSVDDYINAIKDENSKKKPGFFSKHGESGQKRANQLLEAIKQSKESSEVRLEIIFDFLKNAKGNWKDPLSFKTVLAGKIAEMRGQSVKEFIEFIEARKDSGLYVPQKEELASPSIKRPKT